MELTEEQKQTLRNLYYSKGDVLQAAMVERLVARGVDEDEAVQAARICSNRIWRNSMASGAFTGVVLGALFTPVVGGVAGSSMATLVGFQTLLHSDACRGVRDWDVQRAVDQLNAGF